MIATGEGVPRRLIGRKGGVPWLGHTCGHCPYCREGRENLCDAPGFTGYSIDGGFATHAVVEAGYAFELPDDTDPVATAPLLCAGLIGWRSLKMAGEGRTIGIYGFGAAAHILVQVCKHRGQSVYAFVRPGDEAGRKFALDLGAVWAGFSGERPPVPLDAAIIFAPAGELVPMALDVVRKGGTVVCGGIHMSDIPSMPYRLLWGERRVVSVANLTRGDGAEFFSIAKAAEVRCVTIVYALEHANEALDDLRAGRINGAAIIVP
ncbi:zinc-binding dehydrogenase family protein (plasmid) [Rhizobium leguminosarum bv. viciae]|nr:zinc-binding dehydrogenase family protein [Rhizobium leguminosarum bv. viciae]